MPDWAAPAGAATLIIVTLVALVLLWLRERQLSALELKHTALEVQHAALKVGAKMAEEKHKVELEFWRDAARFAQLQDAKTRVFEPQPVGNESGFRQRR